MPEKVLEYLKFFGRTSFEFELFTWKRQSAVLFGQEYGTERSSEENETCFTECRLMFN